MEKKRYYGEYGNEYRLKQPLKEAKDNQNIRLIDFEIVFFDLKND